MDVVLPSCPFPPIPWLVLAEGKNAVINAHEHYEKQSWRNRFCIATAQGKVILTIPVHGQKGMKTPMKDMRIFEGPWRRQHMHTLKSSYGKSAFFPHFEEQLTHLISEGHQKYLLDFNQQSWEMCSRFFPFIKTEVANDFFAVQNEPWEPAFSWPILPSYPQVFADRQPFQSGLSVLDLLMNSGLDSLDYILLLKNGCYISLERDDH